MGTTAAIGFLAAGTASNVIGQQKSGKYNQQIANYNASVAEYQAQDAITRGQETERRQRLNTRRLIGAQRASLAAQGIDVNQDTALDIQLDSAYLGELDALTIRNNAVREAFGFRTQSVDSRLRGEISRAEANTKSFSTILGAGGNLFARKYGFGADKKSTKLDNDYDY